MQNELDIVRDVSKRLDGAGIRYMLTGSIAMTDTPPEIAEMVRQRLMARSGEERFMRVWRRLKRLAKSCWPPCRKACLQKNESANRISEFMANRCPFNAATATAATASSSSPPCGPLPTARVLRAGVLKLSPAAKAQCVTPHYAPLVSKPFRSHASVSQRLFHRVGLCDTHSLRSDAFSPMSCLLPAGAISLPRAAPPTSQWQSPAWSSAHHACLRGYGASLPAQTRRLACSRTFLRAHLCAPVRLLLAQA